MSDREVARQISRYVRAFEGLSIDAKDRAVSMYGAKAMAEFLFQVNNIEGEGFDTLEETYAALDEQLSGVFDGTEVMIPTRENGDDRVEAVSSLYRALQIWFSGEEGFNFAKLLKSHELLMESSNPAIAGRFRGTDEYASSVSLSGKQHLYTLPSSIWVKLSKLFQEANSVLCLNTKDYNLLEYAASFFYRFECIHPFVDGNGRMGRILLAYMLWRRVSLFPNVLFVRSASEEPPFVDRRIYLECFENAREVDDNVPRDLTSLVIEGVYVGWNRFFEELKRDGDELSEQLALAMGELDNEPDDAQADDNLKESKSDCDDSWLSFL